MCYISCIFHYIDKIYIHCKLRCQQPLSHTFARGVRCCTSLILPWDIQEILVVFQHLGYLDLEKGDKDSGENNGLYSKLEFIIQFIVDVVTNYVCGHAQDANITQDLRKDYRFRTTRI